MVSITHETLPAFTFVRLRRGTAGHRKIHRHQLPGAFKERKLRQMRVSPTFSRYPNRSPRRPLIAVTFFCSR